MRLDPDKTRDRFAFSRRQLREVGVFLRYERELAALDSGPRRGRREPPSRLVARAHGFGAVAV
jgi:hypothetical protein